MLAIHENIFPSLFNPDFVAHLLIVCSVLYLKKEIEKNSLGIHSIPGRHIYGLDV